MRRTTTNSQRARDDWLRGSPLGGHIALCAPSQMAASWEGVSGSQERVKAPAFSLRGAFANCDGAEEAHYY